MQVSTDRRIWNDAHMQSRAKRHHVAVLSGKIVKFHVPKAFSWFSSTLVTKVGTSLTHVSNRFYHVLMLF